MFKQTQIYFSIKISQRINFFQYGFVKYFLNPVFIMKRSSHQSGHSHEDSSQSKYKKGTPPFGIQHLHPSIGAATTGATLTRATLIEAAQTNANLSCAILLNGTSLTGATLTAAAITGAILTGTTMTGVYPNWIWPANRNPLTGGCQPGATQIKPTGGSLTEACKKYSSLGDSIKVCSSCLAQVRHASVRVALT